KLLETGRDRYTLAKAAANKNMVIGKLTMHRDGYGFVIPESEEVRGSIQGDIYIPPMAMGPAMHGDRVMVELGRRRDEGRAEGRILKVVDRAHATVVGTFHYGDRSNYVRPIDEKMTVDIIIPRGKEWPAESAEDEADIESQVDIRRPAPRAAKSNVNRVLGKEAKRSE